MRLRISALAIVAALAVSAPPAPAAESIQLLSVESGHSVLLQTPGLSRVAVGDGRIAGVLPIGTAQLVVNGKAPGQTTVFVWEAGRRLAFEVTVTEQSMDDLAQMLRTSITTPGVQVFAFRNSVVLRGTVADGAQFTQLDDIITRFADYAKKENSEIVNAVTVAHPLGDLQGELSNIPGAGLIRVDPDGKGNVIVSGHVHDTVTAQAVIDRAIGLAGHYLAADGKVINRISTDLNSQIDVKVYVLEVDQTALDNLGVQLQSATFHPDGTYTLGQPSFPVIENPANLEPAKGFTISNAFFRTVTLAPTLNLLISEGHAHVLSSPDLVTTPGNDAKFLVGGSIPVIYSTGLGQVSVIYKDYGVQLEVTPTILGNGGIDAKIDPDISDLDFQDGVNYNGFVVPALKESRLSTDVITQPGESIIMGGMLRRVEERNISKIPLLSSIPILGKLFQSTQYQNSQSDVVFVMTPAIVTR
jgi:pilus assembly protein CpaC